MLPFYPGPRVGIALAQRDSALLLARSCKRLGRPVEWVREHVATARTCHAEAMRLIRPMLTGLRAHPPSPPSHEIPAP